MGALIVSAAWYTTSVILIHFANVGSYITTPAGTQTAFQIVPQNTISLNAIWYSTFTNAPSSVLSTNGALSFNLDTNGLNPNSEYVLAVNATVVDRSLLYGWSQTDVWIVNINSSPVATPLGILPALHMQNCDVKISNSFDPRTLSNTIRLSGFTADFVNLERLSSAVVLELPTWMSPTIGSTSLAPCSCIVSIAGAGNYQGTCASYASSVRCNININAASDGVLNYIVPSNTLVTATFTNVGLPYFFVGNNLNNVGYFSLTSRSGLFQKEETDLAVIQSAVYPGSMARCSFSWFNAVYRQAGPSVVPSALPDVYW